MGPGRTGGDDLHLRNLNGIPDHPAGVSILDKTKWVNTEEHR